MTTLVVRFFKNHRLLTLTVAEAAALCLEAELFTIASGTLQHQRALDIKYPGYHVWALLPAEDMIGLGIVPCDSIVVIRDGESPPCHHNIQHKTAHPDSEDFAKLDKVVWHQLGTKGSETIYLFRLEKNPMFDTALCTDEETGKPYPYMLTKVLVLRKEE